MTKVYYIVATTAGGFRAKEGARFPWTDDEQEARRFAQATDALATIRDHAGFMARPFRDYVLLEVLDEEDGTMPMRQIDHDGYRPLEALGA